MNPARQPLASPDAPSAPAGGLRPTHVGWLLIAAGGLSSVGSLHSLWSLLLAPAEYGSTFSDISMLVLLAVPLVTIVAGLETVAGDLYSERFCREAWRVLASGGRLMVVVPNRRGIWARIA